MKIKERARTHPKGRELPQNSSEASNGIIYLKPQCTLALAGLMLLSACSSLLPSSRNESLTFKTFDEARAAVESLVPMKSDLATLKGLGIDPARQPNTVILTHSDVIRRVMNGNVLTKDDLDPGIVTCINARDACRGWELTVASITRRRTGGFWADFVNFRRQTETTGWRFNALILMVNDLVVYRAWGGQPRVNEVEITTNPLGPLQEIGPAVITNR